MDRLKQLRIKNRFTQSYVAKKLNMTRQGYANYENGVTSPPPDMLVKISKLYNCSVDYILKNNYKNCAITLSEEDSQIINQYNSLSEDNKSLVKIFLNVLVSKKTKLK